MDRVVLRYGKGSFIITTILLAIASVALVVFLLSFETGKDIALPIGVLCSLCILVYGIVPMFTYHYVEDGELVLNQGLFFRGKVPITEIESSRVLEKGPFRTGVFFNIRGSVLYVTTRRNELVEIKLKERRRFGLAFGKSVNTVVFDCIEPQRAREALSGPLTPSNRSQ